MRICGGQWRGRRLESAPASRPTTERIREALFSIWRDRVGGSRFVDLFCGGGAIGLEAASRGAAEVVFVDNDRRALEAVTRNGRALRYESLSVRRLEIPRGLRRGKPSGLGEFDLLYADPPYEFELAEDVLAAIAALLRPGGRAALEHDRRREIASYADLEPQDCREYGDSSVSFFVRRS